jgi:hypothetical protein
MAMATGVRQPVRLAHRAAGRGFFAASEVAGPGFGRHQRDRRLRAKRALPEVGVDQEGVFVERAEQARARQCVEHHRPGVLDETAIAHPAVCGVVDAHHRMAMFGQARNAGIRHRRGAGGKQQRIVGQHLAIVQNDLVERRLDAPDAAVDECDAARFQIRLDRERDFRAGAPAHRQPGIRRDEMEIGGVGHHRHAIARTQLLSA